jgi:hypothetical protein
MYTLVWRERALDRLADIYVAVDPATRAAIAAGVIALNKRLAADPLHEGESRYGGYRVTFTQSLAVSFHVNVADRIVRVTSVVRSGRP